jgi:hypothetical protein
MWDLWWTKLHWDMFFSEFFGFLCQHIIPLLLHTHLSPPLEVCDSSDHAASYHILGARGFVSDPAFGWNRGEKKN